MKQIKKRKVHRYMIRGWKASRVYGTASLWRLVGPGFDNKKNKVRPICIAIGGKRLRSVAKVLNAIELEV